MQKIEICQEYVEQKDRVTDIVNHVFFDVDSCVTGVEGINEMARIQGCEEEIALFTRQAMDGIVPLPEVFGTRLDIIQPCRSDLDIVAHRYIQHVTPHAPEVIKFLQGIGVQVWLISGGYRDAIYPLADYLQVKRSHVFANHLFFHEDGSYAGFDHTNPLCGELGKKKFIQALRETNIVRGTVALVGDGAPEVEAKEVVDMCIGFGGHVIRERVREEADYYVQDETFVSLLPVLLQKLPTMVVDR